MKMIMIPVAFALVLITACSSYRQGQGNNVATEKTQPVLDSSKWYLMAMHRDGVKNEIARGKAFISFHPEKKSAGGNGSCNSFGSTMILEGNRISFKDIFSTKMFCESVQETENGFFERLAKVSRYAVKGDRLLLFEGEQVLLEFSKEESGK